MRNRMNRNSLFVGGAFGSLLLLLMCGGFVYGQTPECINNDQLVAPDGDTDDYFAASIAMDQDFAVIGASLDDLSAGIENAGSAYIWVPTSSGDSWEHRQKIDLGPDAEEFEYFGECVDISDDVAVVAAPGWDGSFSEQGKVFVYRRDTSQPQSSEWQPEDELVSQTPESDGEFGGDVAASHSAVAVSGDVIVVGAPGETVEDDSMQDVTNTGRIYIFRYNSLTGEWDHEETFEPDDPQETDYRFGESVDTDGSRIIVGAPGMTVQGQPDDFDDAGKAFVIDYDDSQDEWIVDATIDPTNPDDGDEFGFAVAIDRDGALVGAPYGNYAEVLKDDSGWYSQKTLTGSEVTGNALFGYAVELDGSLALVGAGNHAHPDGPTAGAAYLYQRIVTGAVDWSEKLVMYMDDGKADFADSFGEVIALDRDQALLGAPGDEADSSTSSEGAMYPQFDFPACDCADCQ